MKFVELKDLKEWQTVKEAVETGVKNVKESVAKINLENIKQELDWAKIRTDIYKGTHILLTHQYTKRDVAIFFVVAIILGAGLKAVAENTVTMGFEDYKLAPSETLVNLNAIQKELLQQKENATSPTAADSVPQGPTCS